MVSEKKGKNFVKQAAQSVQASKADKLQLLSENLRFSLPCFTDNSG